MKPATSASLFLFLGLLLTACAGDIPTTTPATMPAPPRALEQKPGPVKADALPGITIRMRVLSVKGQPPEPTQEFTYAFFGNIAAGACKGDAWGTPLRVEKSTYDKVLAPNSYPNNHMKGYPVVLRMYVMGVVDPTRVEAEATIDGQQQAWKMEGELSGSAWGMLLWRDKQDVPRLMSMTQYNRHFWAQLSGREMAQAERPKFFPIVDRYIAGDSDRLGLFEGVQGLAKAGYSAVMVNPDTLSREALLSTGNRRTAWAVYSPPGYAFDHDGANPDYVAGWAQKQAQPIVAAGFDPRDVAMYAISDEPGWYYPQAFASLNKNPVALQRFRDYLKAQNLTPADLGHADWATVFPISRSKAVDLPSKRLFYWTMRFFPWDSSRHFAITTRAMEQVFYPGMPIFTNWNFFAGRSFVPGPVANNTAKTDPDAGMGGHDWFEFARMRGGTMLWTEDWFGDEQAYQWSFYAAKLSSAARKGQIEWGGYVIPRKAGQRRYGLEQKILSIAGHGGKGIKYFVFGPEYVFPGNCYSQKSELLPLLADAHRVVAKAEPLLWPGRPKQAEVAILYPRSAQMWDAKNVKVPTLIDDATNTNLNRRTVDYMAEIFNLYLAFQHQNIAADFVEEDDLSPAGLKGYKAVYVTTPNLPVENQQSLLEWVKAGGTLVTVPGAAMADRYDEPCDVLAKGTGIERGATERVLVGDLKGMTASGEVNVPVDGRVLKAFGALEKEASSGQAEGVLDLAGRSALVSKPVALGKAYHFRLMPGLSYFRTSSAATGRLPGEFDQALARTIAVPALKAGCARRAESVPFMVETPVLYSDRGAAVTLLNWNDAPLARVTAQVPLDFSPSNVTSVKRGKLDFERTKAGVTFSLPLDAADVVMIWR